MAATSDIVATYRGPGRVVRRIVARGQREDRALVYLLIGCLMVFVAQTPRLARQSHVTGEELPMLMGASLLAWICIAPLIFYGLAGISHIIARLLGGKQSPYGARIALFWALLASCPVMLLWGLTAGFVGPGIEMSGVGILWLVVFLWFWLGGLFGASKGPT